MTAMASNQVSQHDTRFWREVAEAYSQVAADHNRQITVGSDAENLVAVVMYDVPNDMAVVSIIAKTGTNPHGLRKEVVTDATDRAT